MKLPYTKNILENLIKKGIGNNVKSKFLFCNTYHTQKTKNTKKSISIFVIIIFF